MILAIKITKARFGLLKNIIKSMSYKHYFLIYCFNRTLLQFKLTCLNYLGV